MSCVIASVVLVSLFLMMIYKVFPSNVKVVAGIFETNMIIGSVAAIFLVVWFMRQTSAVVDVSFDENEGNLNGDKGSYSGKRVEKEPLNQKNE